MSKICFRPKLELFNAHVAAVVVVVVAAAAVVANAPK